METASASPPEESQPPSNAQRDRPKLYLAFNHLCQTTEFIYTNVFSSLSVHVNITPLQHHTLLYDDTLDIVVLMYSASCLEMHNKFQETIVPISTG